MRDPEVGQRSVDAIRAEHAAASVTFEQLDLADLQSVADFGERVRARHDRLEVLVNNAGVVMPLHRETTADGFELHSGTDQLGHFALVAGLLPLLTAADLARVVVVGSLAHRIRRVDFDDLQAERSYRRVRAYAQSKLANLQFMTELQQGSDTEGWGVTAVGAHPGFARTEATLRPDDSAAKRRVAASVSGLVPTAERAARPIVHAATAPVSPAGYYRPSGPGEVAGRVGPAKLAARAQNRAVAARLWGVSETLTDVEFAAH